MTALAAILRRRTLLAAAAAAATYSAKPLAAPRRDQDHRRDISLELRPRRLPGRDRGKPPAVLCQSLAKRAGRLESFVVDGRAFAAAELDKCNAGPRAAPGARQRNNRLPGPRRTRVARPAPSLGAPFFRACTIAPKGPPS
jgi:hypothetical protein